MLRNIIKCTNDFIENACLAQSNSKWNRKKKYFIEFRSRINNKIVYLFCRFCFVVLLSHCICFGRMTIKLNKFFSIRFGLWVSIYRINFISTHVKSIYKSAFIHINSYDNFLDLNATQSANNRFFFSLSMKLTLIPPEI